MAARLIEQQDVSNACNDLVKAGEQPSTLKVRKMLGKGSPNTIQKFIQFWRDSDDAQNAKAALLPAVVELPREFVEEGELLLKKIFRIAEQQHTAKGERIKQEAEQAMAAARAETDEALEYASGIGDENEDLKDDLSAAQEKIAALEVEIGSQKAKNEQLSETNTVLQDQVSTLTGQVEQLTTTTSRLETDKALVAQERDSAKKSLDAAEKHHKDEMANLKKEHSKALDMLTKTHISTVSDLKNAHHQTVDVLQNSITDARNERDVLKSKLEKAEKETAKRKVVSRKKESKEPQEGLL